MNHPSRVLSPTEINTTDSRIAWIDVARGLAMLLVVYNHVCMGLWTAGIPFWPNPYSGPFLLIRSAMLPLLLLCSGAVIEQSLRNGLLEFLVKKTRRLLIPYIIWSVILAGLYWSFSAWMNVSPRANGPVDFLILGGGGPILFLALLFLTQVVYALLRTLGIPPAWIFVPAGALALVVRPDNRLADSFSTGLGMLLFVVLGAIAGPAFKSIARLSLPRLSLACLGALGTIAGIALLVGRRVRLDPAIRTAIATVVACSGSVLGAGAGRTRLGTPLSLIGRYSLEILVLHTVATAGARIVLARGLHLRDMLLHLSIGMLAGIGLPILAAWIADRCRLRRLFRP